MGPVHAVGIEHRLVDRILAGQAGRVRLRRARAGRGGADLGDHHRLARRTRRGQRLAQARAVAAAFDVGKDHAGVRVIGQPCDHVCHLQPGFVAGGDPVAQAQSRLARQRIGVGTEGTALADQPDFADRRHATERDRREGGKHALAQVHRAQAVRAQQCHARIARAAGQHVLHAHAALPGFREAGGEDHGGARAVAGQLRHHVLAGAGRHRHDGQVDGLADVRQRAIGAQTLHFGSGRVDRIEASRVAQFAQQPDRHPAHLVWLGGSTDHRDRTRVQQGIQVNHVAVSGSCFLDRFNRAWPGYCRRPVAASIERTISISSGATFFSIIPRFTCEPGTAQLNSSGRFRYLMRE
ncbi:hypothetical protein D9M68_479430 [compost metagenome]